MRPPMAFSIGLLYLLRCGAGVRLGTPPYTTRVPCNVLCTAGKIKGGLVWTVELPDIKARIVLSMEGSQYYPQLLLRPRQQRYALRQFQGTTDLSSDIPMPYYEWPWTQYLDAPPLHAFANVNVWSYNTIQTPPLPFHETLPRALFLARNCRSRNRREDVVKKLQAYGVPVDSPSSCLHFTRDRTPTNLRNKTRVMEQYRVYFAFENQNTVDYVTEKLWGAFSSGVIPVYYGAPNIAGLIPPKSAIIVQSFRSFEDAAAEIIRAITIPSVNALYHQWRFKPLPDFFVRLWNFTHVHSQCRLCRFVHGML